MTWKIIARHKWVSNATITESELIEDDIPSGLTLYRRFTATILGWRGFRIFEGRIYSGVGGDVRAKVTEIRDRIEAGDESVFHESSCIDEDLARDVTVAS